MQLYLVTVSVDLGTATEETKVCVVGGNAEAAGEAACIHCQVAPSMATVTVKRVKRNCYGFEQVTRRKPVIPAIVPADRQNDGRGDAAPPEIASIEAYVRRIDHRPELTKRRLELRATIFSRTDGAACTGVAKGLDAFGRTGRWETDFVELEDIKVVEAEELRPNNPRVLENSQYSVTRVFRN